MNEKDNQEWWKKYQALDDKTLDELAKRFNFHPVFGDQGSRYEFIRHQFKKLAELLHELCPQSRELSLSITNLEQAQFWANASIARNETPPEEGPEAAG